jgi:WD40 repeat protein
LIRLFDTKTGDKINELRRGTKEALVTHLNFDADSNFLTCCSDRTKIHIFKVKTGANTASVFGYSAISYFVPVAGSQWSFA